MKFLLSFLLTLIYDDKIILPKAVDNQIILQ